MRHQSHFSPAEGMWYFAQPSHSWTPGGRDGEWEIIRAYHAKEEYRWNLDNMMVALIKDERVAEETARIMALHGVVKAAIPEPLPVPSTRDVEP